MSTKSARVIILMAPEDRTAWVELAHERCERVGASIRALVEAERAIRQETHRTTNSGGSGSGIPETEVLMGTENVFGRRALAEPRSRGAGESGPR